MPAQCSWDPYLVHVGQLLTQHAGQGVNRGLVLPAVLLIDAAEMNRLGVDQAQRREIFVAADADRGLPS